MSNQPKEAAVSSAGLGSAVPQLHLRPRQQRPPLQTLSESAISSDTGVSQLPPLGLGVGGEGRGLLEKLNTQEQSSIISMLFVNYLNGMFPL